MQIEIRNLYEKIPPKPVREEAERLQSENRVLRAKLDELGVQVDSWAPLAGQETDVSRPVYCLHAELL